MQEGRLTGGMRRNGLMLFSARRGRGEVSARVERRDGRWKQSWEVEAMTRRGPIRACLRRVELQPCGSFDAVMGGGRVDSRLAGE